MKRIFITGIKGGVGTTVTIANLACALVNARESVAVIDLDPKNELRLHFGMAWDAPQGWSHVANKGESWPQHFQQDSDGVLFLPYGVASNNPLSAGDIVEQSRKLAIPDHSWLLFDCPAHLSATEMNLATDDIYIQIINCDAACHSRLSEIKLHSLQGNNVACQQYYLINRFNSGSPLEVDIYQLWRADLPSLAPFFIHCDEAVKEALAFKNVAYNCAPHSVVIDDYQALTSWLVSKLR